MGGCWLLCVCMAMFPDPKLLSPCCSQKVPGRKRRTSSSVWSAQTLASAPTGSWPHSAALAAS
ncbi:Bcl-2-related ovarian killer protein, isoform CRA_a [Rattus norvegicus]|uniref:Bcl-2-related ovarian killer protein, isoform CRA_a n=1 Tax=Rattus norvegicus TaxID=10116 RepID=A6JR26_RAT|nr:Bcl-2-related ovarian killer protein, isoform CRA_a [Rattus norvegicus]